MPKKEAEKPDDDFIIPKTFLKQLEEFANGGYILLTFSSKGNPVIHHAFETKKDQLALESAFFTYGNKLDNKKFDEEQGEILDEDDEEESG
jgi:hypothetical protein